MSEIKRNEIIYEEGWRDSSVTPDIESDIDSETEAPEIQPSNSRPLLICIQLVMCLLAALALFLLKAMDSGYYHTFIDAYHEELEKPLVSREAFNEYDLSRLFPEEKVRATADEAQTR